MNMSDISSEGDLPASSSDTTESERLSPLLLSDEWSDDNDDEDSPLEDLDYHFEYLNEKQKVLSRAALYMSRDKHYAAYTARSTKPEPENSSSLWNEAKDILSAINSIQGMKKKGKASPKASNLPKPGARSFTEAEAPPPSKRHCIDLSVVHRVSSNSIRDGEIIILAPKKAEVADCASSVHVGGHWMAKALQKFHVPGASSWGVQKNFFAGESVLLDSEVGAEDVTTLEEALSFTANARLIVSATPPFSVVHANKAFSSLSGLDAHLTIGCAVESFLENVEQADGLGVTVANVGNNLIGWMKVTGSSIPKSPCQVRVVPVVEPGSARTAVLSASVTSKSTPPMSHILIQLQPVETAFSTALALMAKIGAGAKDFTASTSPDGVIGMVG